MVGPDAYPELLRQARTDPEALRPSAWPADQAPSAGHTLSLAACVSQPELLYHQLCRQADDPADERQLRAYASVLHQDMALSVVGPLTLRLFLDRQSQVPDLRDVWLDSSTETRQWCWQDRGPLLDSEAFIPAMASWANSQYKAFREALGVSPGSYWSSVGLGLCAPFSALYDKAPPQLLCEAATAWLERFDCAAKRYIDWIPATFSGHPCAIPQRRGCCLNYKLPEGGYCGTCGIYRKERLAAISPPHRRNKAPALRQPAG